jgi:hypothetical protein
MQTNAQTIVGRTGSENRVLLPQLSPDSIPLFIRQSPLMKEGGFQIFEGLIDERIRKEMLAEAVSMLPFANACEVKVADDEEVRGGKPRRSFINGQGGSVQQAFCGAPWLLDFLRSLTNCTVTPTGAVGTYSYYIRPGDYLDIHRDIVDCDIAVISCLSEGPMDDGEGGRLCLYPERIFEVLSSIRATPQKGAVKVRMDPGQTIVLYGGIVPHALLKVAEGQARVVSVLCYRARGPR